MVETAFNEVIMKMLQFVPESSILELLKTAGFPGGPEWELRLLTNQSSLRGETRLCMICHDIKKIDNDKCDSNNPDRSLRNELPPVPCIHKR